MAVSELLPELPGQLALGDQLADVGQRLALGAVVPWPELAIEWVRCLPRGSRFTSEDLTCAVGLPRGDDVGSNRNNAVGAVIRAAASRELVELERYVKAQRPSSHGAVIGLWVRL